MPTEDDDEDDSAISMEEWFEMSEADRERELQGAMNEWSEVWDRMTPAQQHHWKVRTALRTCLRWRGLIKKMDIPVFKKYLRERQRRLLQLRTERVTGLQTGTA